MAGIVDDRRIRFKHIPRTTLSRVATFLGSTAMALDVRSFACSCKLASVAVQKLPSMTAKVDPPEAPEIHPDGSLRELEADVLVRLSRAGLAVQVLRLEGAVTAECAVAALRSCANAHCLELNSSSAVWWGTAVAASGRGVASDRVTTLVVDRTHQLYQFDAMVASLPALTSLTVVGCPDITQDDLEAAVPGLGGLRQLTLSRCRGVNDFALGAVSAALPSPSRMERLCLSSSPAITSSGVGAFVAAHAGLVSLDIAMCSRVAEDVCSALVASGVLPSLRRLRLPPSVGDAGLSGLIAGAGGAAAASAHGGPSPLGRLEHLGLSMSSVTDSGLAAVLGAAPARRVLDLQGCAAMSFRVVDTIVSAGRSLQRVDIRGHRRLRWDDAAKLVAGLPDLVLVVADAPIATSTKLLEAAGPCSVRLRESPGLVAV